jgi:hypothetical protein
MVGIAFLMGGVAFLAVAPALPATKKLPPMATTGAMSSNRAECLRDRPRTMLVAPFFNVFRRRYDRAHIGKHGDVHIRGVSRGDRMEMIQEGSTAHRVELPGAKRPKSLADNGSRPSCESASVSGQQRVVRLFFLREVEA